MKISTELKRLEERLRLLVDVLQLDPSCPWTRAFESALAVTREYLAEMPDRQAIINLSQSITLVYGGAGSFNDYYPGVFDAGTGKFTRVPGTEAFERLASEVFESAQSLREAPEAV